MILYTKNSTPPKKGGFIETELTQEEIEDYIKQGFIVEEY